MAALTIQDVRREIWNALQRYRNELEGLDVGVIEVDKIRELTSGAGVTVEDDLFLDEDLYVDDIYERTSDHGVVVHADLDLSGQALRFHSTVYIELDGASLSFVTGMVERFHVDATSLDLSVDLDLSGNDLLDVGNLSVDGIDGLSDPLLIHAWDATAGDTDGHDFHLRAGRASGTGIDGNLILQDVDGNARLTVSGATGSLSANDTLNVLGLLTAAAALNVTGDVNVVAGDVYVDQGKKIFFDTDLDTYGYCIADDLFFFYAGGVLDFGFSSTAIDVFVNVDMNTKDIQNAGDVECDSLTKDGAGAIVVNSTISIANLDQIAAKGDDMLGTAADTWGVLTAGSNGQIRVCDSGEATGHKYVGQIMPLIFHYPGTSSGASLNTYSAYPTLGGLSTQRDLPVPWDGEVVAIDAWVDVNAYTSGDIAYQVWINGVASSSGAQFTPSGVANGQASSETGLSISFSAGDNIACRRIYVSGVGITTDDVVVILYVRVKAT
jgi:hypothetical protein